MERKEFIKKLYSRISNNKGGRNNQLDASDFAECLCNISDDGKNDSIYIELDPCKVPGGGAYLLRIQEIERLKNNYSELEDNCNKLFDENIELKKRLENVYSGEDTDEQLKGAVVDIDKWEVWIDLW